MLYRGAPSKDPWGTLRTSSWKINNRLNNLIFSYRILTSELSFFDSLRSQVIILEQSVLVMNKSQAEKKVYAFHTVFRVDVNDVKLFQNPTRSPFDHFIDPQSMPRLFQTINR